MEAQEKGIKLWKQILADVENLEDQHSKDLRDYVIESIVSIYNALMPYNTNKEFDVTVQFQQPNFSFFRNIQNSTAT